MTYLARNTDNPTHCNTQFSQASKDAIGTSELFLVQHRPIPHKTTQNLPYLVKRFRQKNMFLMIFWPKSKKNQLSVVAFLCILYFFMFLLPLKLLPTPPSAGPPLAGGMPVACRALLLFLNKRLEPLTMTSAWWESSFFPTDHQNDTESTAVWLPAFI